MGDAVGCEQCSCITPVGSNIKQKTKMAGFSKVCLLLLVATSALGQRAGKNLRGTFPFNSRNNAAAHHGHHGHHEEHAHHAQISNKKQKWPVSARFACSSSSLLALLDSALERIFVVLSHSTLETMLLLIMDIMVITKSMLITLLMTPVMPVNVDVEAVMM